MSDFDEREKDAAEEIEFPKTSESDIPGGDATSDVLSADKIKDEYRETQKTEDNHTDNFRSAPFEERPGEYDRGPAAQSDRPYSSEAPYGSGPNAQGQYSREPYNGAENDPRRYNERPYYPYGGQRPEAQRDPRADGYDYYRNVYSNAGNRGAQNDPYPYANKQQNYAYPDGPAPKKSRAGRVVFIILAVLLAVCIFAGGVAFVSGRLKANYSGKTDDNKETIDNVDEIVTSSTPEIKASSSSSADSMDPKDIYKKVLESSVGILVYDGSHRLASEGSGVIFKEDNDREYTYIITCAHVISDKGVSIMVQLFNEKEYKADVVGYDAKTDIGVLRIKEKDLSACEIGDSSKLSVGDQVYAIGNPGGTEFANSFTNGMISAIDRPVSSSSTGYTMECIQHTAAINPGNSGGALLNVFGQVIGINSMKIIADEYEGMGFSVPSSVFVNIVNEIIANGYVTNRPKIGITYIPASSEQAYAMFVAIKGLPAGSIIVYSINQDSSLADTKLQKGDLIVGVDGRDLENSSDLAELVEKSKVGDKLTLSIVRINSDYTYEEFEVVATLVEDKGDIFAEEETTTSYFDDYFGNRDSDGYGYGYGGSDFFSDFFDKYFSAP